MAVLEQTLLIQEVENALTYSLQDNRIDLKRLEYYRINMAEDSRCKFEIWDILDSYSLVFVKYRKMTFICKMEIKEIVVIKTG